MTNSSDTVIAAIRAFHGESDVDVVLPALESWSTAHVVATSVHADPVIRTLAALAGDMKSLLNPADVRSPDIHHAVQRVIGSRAGAAVLRTWASMVRTGWGASFTGKIFNAVRAATCAPGVAAALIGPDETTADLLSSPDDIVFAIRRWGQTFSDDDPSGWVTSIPKALRQRLYDLLLRSNPNTACPFAACLPWLPPDDASAYHVRDNDVTTILDAFTAASPAARTRHESRIHDIIARARPQHLGSLTRLACAMGSTVVWDRIHALLNASPDNAYRVAIAAPWSAWPDNIRAVCAVQSANVVAASHAHARERVIPWHHAIVFFATLTPSVWNALDMNAKQQWLRALNDVHWLAVRTVGPLPEILADAMLSDDLVSAMRVHVADDNALRRMLHPAALRCVSSSDAHALITALPDMPDDPVAFFCVASGQCSPSAIVPHATSVFRSLDDLAASVVLQRSNPRFSSTMDQIAALRTALHARPWRDIHSMCALLDEATHRVVLPDLDALAERLAHHARRNDLRKALDDLAALPPETAIPTFYALSIMADAYSETALREASAALAQTLHPYGDLMIAVADALEDQRRAALLPLPDDPSLASAMRGLAHDAPYAAVRFAHAVRDQAWEAAIAALLDAQPSLAQSVLESGQASVSVPMCMAAASRIATLAADGCEQELLHAWWNLAIASPLPALALSSLAADDSGEPSKGLALLAAHLDRVRPLLNLIHERMRITLLAHADVRSVHQSKHACTHRRSRG